MSIFIRQLYKTPFLKCLCVSIYTNKTFGNTYKMTAVKRLAAFDFDKTIIIDNSDSAAMNLLPKDCIPDYTGIGWTSLMRLVFEQLYLKGIKKPVIEKAIIDIEPISGMCELVKDLSENLNFDVIIISDSNSYFISTWLNEHQLANNIKKVFTNPAEFVDGLLKIEPYHDQDSCTLSQRNMCKGLILEDFIKARKAVDVTYSHVVYVGDGANDFCPVLRLNPGDLAFCRRGFKCAEMVKDTLENKPVQDEIYEVRAGVHLWDTGFDVLNVIKETLKQ